MPTNGLAIFLMCIGTIVSIFGLIMLIYSLVNLFTDVIPDIQSEHKKFKSLVDMKFSVIEERICRIEKNNDELQ